MERQFIILGCVIAYMLLSIGVGIWAIRRTKSAHDFFVAGRSLGPLVVGMAVFSSTLSGFGFVGGPGLVYNSGWSSVWMVSVAALGYSMAFFLVANRIRMIAEVRDTISLPDVLAVRYKSEAVRLLTGIAVLIGVLGYLAVQIGAMALVLQIILKATPGLENISLLSCAVISLAVLLFYSITGGIVASVYTDLVQGIIMMIAGILVVFTAASVFDGGFTEASQIIFEDDPETILPFGTLGMAASLAWFFLFGIGLGAQPHIVTKFMMNRRIEDNRIILPISLIGYSVAALLWISVGVVMHAVVLKGILPPLDAADNAAPVFLSVFANPWLAGIVFAGLFAAIMSTADSFLNIGAAAAIHDIPRAIRGRPLSNELMWARIATFILCVVSAVIVFNSKELLAILGAFGWGMFAAALVPVVVMGLNWKGATAEGAVSAIAASIFVNLAVQLKWMTVPNAMDGGFIALLISMIIFILVSLSTKRPYIDRDIDEIMEI